MSRIDKIVTDERKQEKDDFEEISLAMLDKSVDYAHWMQENIMKYENPEEGFIETVEIALKHLGFDLWFMAQPIHRIVLDSQEQSEELIKKILKGPFGLGGNKHKIDFAEKTAHTIMLVVVAKYIKEMMGEIENYREQKAKGEA